MAAHTDSLDFKSETEAERLARILAENDANLLWELVELRRRSFTQQDVADKLGVAQATIAAFERYDNDPKLSTIRRYAHAVGALIRHEVSESSKEVWDADAVVEISMRTQQAYAARTGWFVAPAS